MGIAHVTNFEKPAVSPFFCVFLELIEGWCVDASRMVKITFALTSAIWAPLCSLVFFETLVRDTTVLVNSRLMRR